uniref:VWFA domain-containing protein n=1 Tax=Suricata suricatta TaxID=37032 RepID=A0A673SLJ2_SURSU
MASTDCTPAPGESGASGVAKKIGSSSLWMPGPALSLLLLLLLPPPLLSTRSFQYHLPAWRPFHQGSRHYRRNTEKLKTCDGSFDLYVVLDTSSHANDVWNNICKFTDELVKRFPNSKMRMSFITTSTQNSTLMKLTSNRNTIRDGLKKLENIVPTGATNLDEGFKKAIEQIRRANSGGNSAASMIVALTAGPLPPTVFEKTKSEAKKARKMDAKVYAVGVKDYKSDQLAGIVERKDQFFGIKSGSKTLEDIVNVIGELVVNSCHEIMDKESYFVCVGEGYEFTFYDTELDEHTMDEIVCRYKLDDADTFDKKPVYKDDESLACPGHKFEKPGQVVVVDYSLNNGVTFIAESMKVTSMSCGGTEPTDAPKAVTSVPTVTKKTTVPTTTTRRTTVSTVLTKTMTLPTTTTWRTTASTVVTQETPGTTAVPEKPTPEYLDYLFPLSVPTLIVIVVVICCLCCYRKPCREPPVPKIIMNSERCVKTRAPVIVPSCMYQEHTIRRIEVRRAFRWG